MSSENKEWLKTIIRLDNNYNIKEEERVSEGIVISEKENTLIKKQVSMIKKYYFTNNTFQIETLDSKGNLIQVFKIENNVQTLIEERKIIY